MTITLKLTFDAIAVDLLERPRRPWADSDNIGMVVRGFIDNGGFMDVR